MLYFFVIVLLLLLLYVFIILHVLHLWVWILLTPLINKLLLLVVYCWLLDDRLSLLKRLLKLFLLYELDFFYRLFKDFLIEFILSFLELLLLFLELLFLK